jgi:sulfide:quinone oxidoreductase
MAGEPAFSSRPGRVLVAGGGTAAVELVIALRKLAGDRVEIELLTPGRELVYRPLLVAEPFGAGSVHRFPLAEILEDQRATLRPGRLEAVEPDAREVVTDGGERVRYHALVVAVGARAVDVLPGALAFDGPRAIQPLRELVERAASGELRALAFVLPPRAAGWPLPLYELALMTAARVPALRVIIATAERSPLELFGAEASAALRQRLVAADVELHTGVTAERFQAGALRTDGADPIEADAAVALPTLEGPALDGLPHDEHGFLPVDEHCRVSGTRDVYAAGDVTAFPVKQGGVAVRQAQAVAECIAARAGAPVTPEPFEPLYRGMLLTGGAPGYLQAGPGESRLADTPLWWPPTKIADSYLVPYLVARFRLSVPTVREPGEADLVSSGPAGQSVPARPGRRSGG